MSDEPLPSLDELRRQRELVAHHLAWLDRQIAAHGIGSRAPTAVPSQPTTAPTPHVPGDHIPSPDPDALLEQYRVAPTHVTRDVRRGCLLYFVFGFALLGAGVWLLYVLLR